ncbi:MAG: N-acetyltransferase [Dehalococcoidia bacterium]|nr:N-acetyltransferase [Dehalococcoidia bacterium]
MAESLPEITRVEDELRFTVVYDERTCELTYRREPGCIRFTHTRVPKELERRGIAGRLARHGLDYARAEGLRVVPQCPYIRAYIEKHPDYQDLLAG